MGEGHPQVGAISWSCPVEALRQYNLAQRREDKKKVLARSVIVQSTFGDDADVTGISTGIPELQQCAVHNIAVIHTFSEADSA